MVGEIIQVYQRWRTMQQGDIKTHPSGHVHESLLLDNNNDSGQRLTKEAIQNNIKTKQANDTTLIYRSETYRQHKIIFIKIALESIKIATL